MAICPRCSKRAAKRFCPALNTTICSVCCARDRMLELVCPESCQYLQSGRERSIERENELRAKELAAEGKAFPRLSQRQLDAVAVIEWAIVRSQREAYRDLEDAEILAAIENALKNLETESSGIIYEHREMSARAYDLSKRIRRSLEDVSSESPADLRIKSAEMTAALRYVCETVQSHMRRGDRRGFIRHTTQFYPWSGEEASSLIVT